MIKVYEDIEAERDRIQKCIQKFGWTSDHNLDWFVVAMTNKEGRPAFAEFEDGSGVLFHIYPQEWHIWSDPLSPKNSATDKILEFSEFALNGATKEVWCDDVSDNIRPALKKDRLSVGDISYSLQWPVLNMEKYDPALPGGHFKDIRNARNKFYKEHKVDVLNSGELDKKILHGIVDNWKNIVGSKDEYNTIKYHNAINNDFRGFLSARVLVVDGKPVGINAGYEVPNNPGRFAGIIGVHDYSRKDLGLILWLEDFDWVKKSGYKKMDIQGDDGGGLKFKMQFNPVIERKTDTFSIVKK